MRECISSLVKDKKILILGFGREGRSSYNLIESVGGFKSLDVADANQVSLPEGSSSTLIHGESYMDYMNEYDVVFKSPGIVLPKDPSEYNCQITCQADLFLRVYGSQIIGITGTKGKSTTSSLTYHILKNAGKDVLFAGNIGLPVFEITDDIQEDTIIVIELSCHQLEYAANNPHIAVLLNLYEDHLDHYGTVEKYHSAKKNIYRFQKANDTLYVGKEWAPTSNECHSNIIGIDAPELPFSSWEELGIKTLRGNHNLINATFVYKICQQYSVSDSDFIEGIKSFKPLAHRLEYIGSKNAVDFYDDSISTTVESAISAIKAISNGSVILIGGMDRGIDYCGLIEYLKDRPIANVICMYESGKRVYNELTKYLSDGLYYRDDLMSAVALSKELAPANTAVILSPAAASYGYFKNFEERGDKFKEYSLDNN